MKISKNKKCISFSCHKDHSIQKLGSQVKRCVLYLVYTRTDRQIDYCGHPFRVSGFFPSTYHQGSPQQTWFLDIYQNKRATENTGTLKKRCTFYSARLLIFLHAFGVDKILCKTSMVLRLQLVEMTMNIEMWGPFLCPCI